MIFGIILARGGSKRLPGKNMRLFGGIPLVGWTISAAKQSHCLDMIAVSSDDEATLDYAYSQGVLPIIRPAHLSTDTASPYDAIRHAYELIKSPFRFICLLQPTSPLRVAWDIQQCVEAFRRLPPFVPAIASRAFGATVPNGAIYLGRTNWLLNGGNFDSPAVAVYEMCGERSVDINTLADFEEAESVLRRRAPFYQLPIDICSDGEQSMSMSHSN